MAESMDREMTESKNDWYIRAFVMSTLLLETLLFYLASLRKRTCSKWVLCLISVLFSLSAWLPSFTLILILGRAISSHGNSNSNEVSNYSPPLLTWASFMLIYRAGHGQQRRTPYSPQTSDRGKELCRILLEFVFYDVIVFGFIYHSQRSKEKLYLALHFVILAYVITIFKVKCLWYPSKEVEEWSKSRAQFPLTVTDEKKIVRFGRDLLRDSHRLFWGHGLTYKERDDCRTFFLGIHPVEAIRIVEVELSMLYDKFYTEIGILPLFFQLYAVCLYPTSESSDEEQYGCPYDPIITISCACLIPLTLCGRWRHRLCLTMVAMFVYWSHRKYVLYFLCDCENEMTPIRYPFDRYSSSMLAILADRLIIDMASYIVALLAFYMSLQTIQKRQSWHRQPRLHFQYSNLFYQLLRKIFNSVVYYTNEYFLYWQCKRLEPQTRTWCGTMSRFNLLAYGLKKSRNLSSSILDYVINVRPVSREKYTDNVGEFIFSEIVALDHTAATNVVSAKGQWVLEQNGYESLVDHEAPFEEIILLWHLATGILYHTCNASSNTDTSMLLSDYMGYLLMVQPWIMSKQRGDAFRASVDIMSEIRELIHSCESETQVDDQRSQIEELIQQSFKNRRVNQNRHCLLQNACDLAEKIKGRIPDVNRMWEMISKVWVEMLAYTAVKSDPMNHVRGLSQGGELASIVWLLMAHLGFVDNFYETPRTQQEREATEHEGLAATSQPALRRWNLRRRTPGDGGGGGGAADLRKRHGSSGSVISFI